LLYSQLDRLQNNCREYVQSHTWDYWMIEVDKIITSL
jgi:hypothetical protein